MPSYTISIAKSILDLIQMALKCADLGHLASPETVHRKWVQLLEEEMFRQVDTTRL